MEIPTPEELQARGQKRDGGVGPMVAIFVIVALIAAGGVYFLVMEEIERQNSPAPGQEQAAA